MELQPGAGAIVDPVAASIAGVVAGLAMLAVRATLSAAGADLRMDVLLMWGTLFGAEGLAGRVIGLGVHFALSAAVAIVYAVAFRIVGASEALWLWGLVGGVVHWIAGGLFLGLVPAMHPEIPHRRAAPGPFARNFGRADVVAFLVAHVAYGVVVGVVYGLAGGARAAHGWATSFY